MVYISSPLIPTASRQAVMQAQSDLAKAQKELSSQALADAGLTLGSQSGQLITLAQEPVKLDAITSSNATVSTRLSATDSALDSIRTAATSFLATLTAAASSGGNTNALAGTATSNMAAFASALDTSVSGQYLFAGINTDTKPVAAYVGTPASAAKQAVDSAFTARFGTSQGAAGAASIDGTAMQSFLDSGFASLFSSAGFAGTWSTASDEVLSSSIAPGQTADTSLSANVAAFRQLAQAYTMVAEFTGTTISADAKQSVLNSAIALTTGAVNGLKDLQAGIGITQSAITDANDSMAAQKTLLSDQFSRLDGVDSYALTVKVSSLQTQIQASYELTAKLQQMSLVNYLA